MKQLHQKPSAGVLGACIFTLVLRAPSSPSAFSRARAEGVGVPRGEHPPQPKHIRHLGHILYEPAFPSFFFFFFCHGAHVMFPPGVTEREPQ